VEENTILASSSKPVPLSSKESGMYYSLIGILGTLIPIPEVVIPLLVMK
jgi:hypothetical protein